VSKHGQRCVLCDQQGEAGVNRLIALAILAVTTILGSAGLTVLVNSSRRRVLVTIIGSAVVSAYTLALVYADSADPAFVIGGWCVSIGFIYLVWRARQLEAVSVRSLVRRCIRRKPVDDMLDWLRFRVDTFPRNVGWLRPLGLPEVHDSTYHDLPWVGVEAGRRPQGTRTRWERIRPLLAEYDVRSALDIGASSGWFSFKLAEYGVPSMAVERGLRGLRLGTYTRKRSGLEDVSFLSMDVTRPRCRGSPRRTASSCSPCGITSFARGLEAGTRILRELWQKTGALLVFETGESEMPRSWGLPEMLPDPRTWLTRYLEQSCAGGTVVHLGLHDALSPNNVPYRRNLFAVVGHGDQQQV